MTTRTALSHVRRGWLFILVLVVAAGALAGVFTAQRKSSYTATAQGFVAVSEASNRTPNTLTSSSLYILARMTTYAQLATTTAVLDPVATSLSYPGGEAALQTAVSAATELNTPFVNVTVTTSNADLAARTANAVVTQLATTLSGYENGTLQLNVSSAAATPTSASNHDVTLDAAAAALAALLIGCALFIGVGWLRFEGSGRPTLAPMPAIG